METTFGLLKDFTSDDHIHVQPHTAGSMVGLNEVSFPTVGHGRVTSGEETRIGNMVSQGSDG